MLVYALKTIYRTRAIITRGLYTFYRFLKFIYVLWRLALCMVSIQRQFVIKSGLYWRVR